MGIKPQRLPLGVESCLFVRVLRLEPRDDPRFALHDSQPDDNFRRSVMFRPSLFQAKAPFWLVVLVAKENNASEVIERRFQVQDRTACRTRVDLQRIPVDMPMCTDSRGLSESRDCFPRQPLLAGTLTDPLPYVGDVVCVEPVNRLDQHPVRKLCPHAEISVRFVDNGDSVAHFVAISVPATHCSPK
jgi:hypothetical protein